MPRISFTEQDAAHIYEWLQMYWRTEETIQCWQCSHLGTRLERFIGPQVSEEVRRLVQENP